MIRASLASIPAREPSLRKTVASLLPQVDRLGVYLNGYGTVPEFLADPRIDVARSEEHGDRGDAGKFFWSDAGDADYHLACDDDLLYPPDFATTMVAACDRYGRRALVGLHGALMREKAAGYYGHTAKRYHCLADVTGDHAVHVIATATLCWHRSIAITPDIFQHPNMADMWVSAWANEHDIPRVVVAHEKGWVTAMKPAGGTIWDASTRKRGGPMDTRERQAEVARRTQWRLTPLPDRPRAVVSIVTYSREKPLRHLLRDVERERASFDGELEVRIYDDASPDYEDVRELCRERGYAYTAARRHYGKAEHWRLITQELADLRAVPADWYVFLPDEVRLCEDFFARAAAVWETLEEPVALNLAYHRARPGSCWTNVEPREVGEGVEVGWVDGLYICKRDLLERLDFRVPDEVRRRARTRSRHNGSSGVGAAISQALVGSGARLYRVKRSLTQHQRVPSLMHPETRETEPQTHMDPVRPFARYPVGAARIVADPADAVGQYVAAGQWYERDVLEAVRATGARGLYVDVGAHVGNHTAFFATECGASVVAIEPNADTYSRLVATVEASRIGERVRTVNAAVHPTWETARPVAPPPGNSGMARVADGGSSGPLAVMRLDDVVDGETVGVVKVDVEGDALGVLESGRRIIERDHPVIVAETGEQTEAITQLLAGMGYAPPDGPYGRTPVYVFQHAAARTELPAPRRRKRRAGGTPDTVRLSIAMMACREREASVERIRAALDRECEVVWDEKRDRWDTGRRAWLAYDPRATHHAVIQDDVLVCRDLVAGLERALSFIPATVPVSGYVGRVRPYRTLIERAVAAAAPHHVSWYTMHVLAWGPLVVVPTAAIEAMLAHCDTLTHVENYDRRLSRFWTLERRSLVWCTRPSLVDHADGPSMVPGRPGTNRARQRDNRTAWDFAGEDVSALDIDWSGDVIAVSKPGQPRERRPGRHRQEHPPIIVRR